MIICPKDPSGYFVFGYSHIRANLKKKKGYAKIGINIEGHGNLKPESTNLYIYISNTQARELI